HDGTQRALAPGGLGPRRRHAALRPRSRDGSRLGAAAAGAYFAGCIDAWWPGAYARMATVRPATTSTFTMQVTGDLNGLDRDAPLYYEGEMPILGSGYGVEWRTLRGHDGRIVALNQQTFTFIA